MSYVSKMLGIISDHSTKMRSVISGSIAAALLSKKIAAIFRLTCLQISDIA